jgi:hypothetical protein
MRAILFLLTSSVIMSFTCNKEASTIPLCIEQKIDTIKAQPKWNPPAVVTEYIYNGKTVYAFTSDCCDQFNPVFDAECNYVCSPSGGFTGLGDGRCRDFLQNAKEVRVVYKDDR